jgi:hypothetical protein
MKNMLKGPGAGCARDKSLAKPSRPAGVEGLFLFAKSGA